jgi:membrane-associated phospholipid phosphatase
LIPLTFLAIFLLFWVLSYFGGPAVERLLGAAAHRTAAFRYRDYVPVVVILSLGVVAAMVAGDGFLDLAEEVQASSAELHAIDSEVHTWARSARTAGSTAFFTAMTVIGTPVGLGILVAIVSAALALVRRPKLVLYLVATTGMGALLNIQLKAWFARARPDLAEALRGAHGYSFPSGHAMGSTIVFVAFSYLVIRTVHHWRFRAPALAAALTMIVAISASRIYLGVHWISDVGAGIAAGLIWAVTTTVAYETFRRIRMVRALRAGRRASSPHPGGS